MNIENSYLFLLVLSFLPVSLYKSNLLKVISFIFSYPMFHIYYLLDGGEAVRILAQIGMAKYSYFIENAFFIYLFSIVAFNIMLIPIRNKTFSFKERYRFTDGSLVFLFLILFASAFISYPWLFGLTERREMLLPGNGWVSIFIGTYLIILLSKNASKFYVKLSLFILPLYFILSGERVNNILFVALIILLDNGVERRLSLKDYYKIIFPILIVFSLAYIAGNVRGGGRVTDFNAFYLFNYITAMEALHVYFSGFWYVEQYGNNLTPLINVISSFIPFFGLGGAGSPYFFENIIADKIYTVGGGMFLTEGYLLFGGFGAVLWALVLGFIIRKTYDSARFYLQVIFVMIFALSFRVFWYGWEYIITPLYIMYLYYLFFRFLGENV